MSDEFPYEGARDEVLFQRELKKLSDDMMLSADPIGRIKDLQSRLTAAETRIKELEATVDRMSNFNCNLNDTLRSRGYGHIAGKHTEERFITFVHAYDALRAELDKLKGSK